MEKPRDRTDHSAFIEELLAKDIESLKSYYNRVSVQIKNDFSNSEFFNDLKSELNDLNDWYQMQEKFILLVLSKCLNLDTKKFDDMMEKSYRKDVLCNEHWEDSDNSWTINYDWVNPLNCFEKLNDILRTRIMIRYLDGARLVLGVLKKVANKHEYSSKIAFKSDEYGYYGVHFVVKYPVEIERINLGSKNILLNVEIQICTQISEVINELLHLYYEKKRLEFHGADKDWRWDYDCDEFIPAYLGHMTHYIEGMIMQSREKVR